MQLLMLGKVISIRVSKAKDNKGFQAPHNTNSDMKIWIFDI